MKLFIEKKIQLKKRLPMWQKKQLAQDCIYTDKGYKYIKEQKCTFNHVDMIEVIDLIKLVSKQNVCFEYFGGNLHYGVGV